MIRFQDAFELLTHAYFQQCDLIAQAKTSAERHQSQTKKAFITVYYAILFSHMQSSAHTNGSGMMASFDIPCVKDYLKANNFLSKRKPAMLLTLPQDAHGLADLEAAIKHVEANTIDDEVLNILADLQKQVKQIRPRKCPQRQAPVRPSSNSPVNPPTPSNNQTVPHRSTLYTEREGKPVISPTRLLLLHNQQIRHRQPITVYPPAKKTSHSF